MAAINQVLSTYELLEQLLLELPVVDIFVLQRVLRSWHSIIQDSHPLRRKSFLLASHPVVTPAHHCESEVIDECHPRYDSFFEINPALARHESRYICTGCPKITQYRVHQEDCALHLLEVEFSRTIELNLNNLDTQHSCTDQKQSWRDMFPVNPSCSSVLLSSRIYPNMGLYDELGCSIFDPAGVKMGLMMGTAKRMLADLFRYTRDEELRRPFDRVAHFVFTFQMKKAEDRMMKYQPCRCEVHRDYN